MSKFTKPEKDEHGENIGWDVCNHHLFLEELHDIEWDCGYYRCAICNKVFLLLINNDLDKAIPAIDQDIDTIKSLIGNNGGIK